ncbi:MAG: hypothetical protein WC223_03370 [Bacteroidales bacterium]|jgi:hypothetical protein
MKKIKVKNLIFILFVVGFIGSCTKDTMKPKVIYPENNATPVSFANDIKPFFTSNCAICHQSGGARVDLATSNCYNDLFTKSCIDTLVPSNSLLYKKINVGGSMEAYSNSGFATKVLNWINQGAKNN